MKIAEGSIKYGVIDACNYISIADVQTGITDIYGSESFGGYTYTKRGPKVTTCKNCGAPVHNNICEYCGTEY